MHKCIIMELNTATNKEYSTAFLLALAVVATLPNEFISLMSSPLLFILEEMSKAMSNGSDFIMLHCDWL